MMNVLVIDVGDSHVKVLATAGKNLVDSNLDRCSLRDAWSPR
jgi:hypothetical protein